MKSHSSINEESWIHVMKSFLEDQDSTFDLSFSLLLYLQYFPIQKSGIQKSVFIDIISTIVLVSGSFLLKINFPDFQEFSWSGFPAGVQPGDGGGLERH